MNIALTNNAIRFSNREKEVVANTKFSCRSLDDTVLTAFSTDDSQAGPDFMDDAFMSLSDDSDRGIPFSELRQFRIHQRSAPFTPGKHIQLYEHYEAAHKAPMWVIRVFQPDKKDQGFRFELQREGDDFAMALYETDILDNVRVLMETEEGGTEELIFQIRMCMGICDKSFEVAGDMIIDHLGLILGMDQHSQSSLKRRRYIKYLMYIYNRFLVNRSDTFL
jgi:hypothetical protein